MADSKQTSYKKNAMIAAIAVTIGTACVLFAGFIDAARHGLSKKFEAQMAMLAPDYEELDELKAKKVPEFTLKDRFGNDVSLSQFEAVDLLVINIWSSGCPVCQEEVPSLVEMDKRLAQIGAALITLTVDEKWEDVAEYFPRGTDLRILFDPDQRAAQDIFGTSKYPETFVLDKERRIRVRFDGKRDWHSREMMTYLESFR